MHLFVGDITEDTTQAAQAVSADAYLITQENCEDDHTGVCYTSLGDIRDLESFYNLLRRADNITLVDKDVWSDGKTKKDPYSMAWHTVQYVKIVSQNNTLPNRRVSDKPCIWLAGCSTTAGVGLDFRRMRYGFRVAEELDLELVDLSKSGTSIEWSATQILQSDVKANDIVIWGLTSNERLPYYYNKELYHINVSNFDLHRKWLNKYMSIDELDSENRNYTNTQSVHCVDNFCKKINAKLVKVSIHCSLDISACAADENLVFIHGQKGNEIESTYLDLGNDGVHPGPLTHQMYAQRILQHLEKRYGNQND